MSSDPEDSEALSWGDEHDPTHADAPEGDAPAVAETAAPATSSALLVSYGVFGGAYLLYVIGWIIAVRQDSLTLPTLFGEIMYQFGEFLAIASPVIWMAAVLLLTQNARPLTRIVWLVVGLPLVAPWPFILGSMS